MIPFTNLANSKIVFDKACYKASNKHLLKSVAIKFEVVFGNFFPPG